MRVSLIAIVVIGLEVARLQLVIGNWDGYVL